jgi:hypothetical protein
MSKIDCYVQSAVACKQLFCCRGMCELFAVRSEICEEFNLPVCGKLQPGIGMMNDISDISPKIDFLGF